MSLSLPVSASLLLSLSLCGALSVSEALVVLLLFLGLDLNHRAATDPKSVNTSATLFIIVSELPSFGDCGEAHKSPEINSNAGRARSERLK